LVNSTLYRLDAAGVRPLVVSHLMAHAIPVRQAGAATITQRYTHALPGELDEAGKKFDRWLAAAEDKGTVARKSRQR
jgi:hypothetical protein